MSDNEEENIDEVDLILAQQIMDDLDVLLLIADGGSDHLNQTPICNFVAKSRTFPLCNLLS